MTALTLPILAIALFGVFGLRGFGPSLALAGATPLGAAVIVGTIAVPTYYFVALILVFTVLISQLSSSQSFFAIPTNTDPPGLKFAGLYLFWAGLVTVTSPLLFGGTVIHYPNQPFSTLVAGYVTQSSVAQLAYLSLGICSFAYLALSTRTRPSIVELLLLTTIGLSAWAWGKSALNLPFPSGLFDNNPFFTIQEVLPGGAPRVRGIFSEPASLAVAALATIGFTTSSIGSSRGARRVMLIAALATATALGFASTSATFLIGLGAMTVAAATLYITRAARRRTERRPSPWFALIALSLGVITLPIVTAQFSSAIAEKADSSSYSDRTTSDANAIDVMTSTFGIGAGTGANRGSSLLPTLLSTVGIIGVALIAILITAILRRVPKTTESRPVIWTLVAFLIGKLVSGPELTDPTGVFWICMGVLANLSCKDHRPADQGRKGQSGHLTDGKRTPAGRLTNPSPTATASSTDPHSAHTNPDPTPVRARIVEP